MIYSLIREEWRTISKRHGHFAQVKRDGFKEIALNYYRNVHCEFLAARVPRWG